MFYSVNRLNISLFRDAIEEAVKYKANPTDIDDQILEELDNFDFKPETTNE